ncbi:Methyl-accepting chemotaxis protein 2 [Ascidiaceihabitans donghaensis]|uniref:Methyl-accepting chemotaxis protein 2 n=1 Tax=Ascidiaceihabitans donghaensis TaxID=1510460 RepID=A0A2R8BEL8_9RHOB|nr:methyl-accepting chemotaxis protein [Ascidiaceihabitans donghaensis]SPH21524.1 Methyl-accepting chemotaxis protein 2 [Ascidiaceihabitans donghaensis]
MNIQAPQTVPPPNNVSRIDDFPMRRDVIDRIATTRAKVIRVGLTGRIIYLPDPITKPSDAEQAAVFDLLAQQIREIEDVKALLTGTYINDDIPKEIADWVFRLAKTMPADVDGVLHMLELSKVIEKTAAQPQNAKALANALKAHMDFARNKGFHDMVTRLCNRLWTDLDSARERKASEAQKSSRAVMSTLGRLEHIGKHVRLVSLNASVEAARAGDAGRGLAVIATEFKSLAEEIQSLATSARAEIETK